MMIQFMAALIFCLSANATQTLIRSDGVSTAEYRGFLLSEDKYETPVRTFLRERPRSENVRELRDRYENAERAFLSAAIAQARQAYLQVTEIALADDWDEVQREMIFHSYLRAAQLTDSGAERKNILRSAVHFNAKVQPDSRFFPPPYLAEFQEIQFSEQPLSLTISPNLRAFSHAIINGEVLELKGTVVPVPRGRFRLTLLADHLAPVTKILDAAELKAWSPPKELLVQGECDAPRFSPKARRDAAALFVNDCVASPARAEVQTSDFERALLREPLASRTETSANKAPFYQQKWFLGVFGAAAAVLVYRSVRDRDSAAEPAPTVKEGF